jgi:hypothetical protein
MSKRTKREQRIRENPENVSLEDFEGLINTYGYIKGNSSHLKARVGSFTLPYKKENPAKPVYVKELLKIIDSL